MLLPCLKHTVAAHQPLAKPYSTVVTVAVCLHESGEPSSTTATTAWWGSPIFPIDCIHWIMTQKKRLRPVKKNSELHHMSRKYVWKLLHWDYWPKRSLMQIWRKFDAMVTWHRNAQLMFCPKATWLKEAWICNYGRSCFGYQPQRTFLLLVSWVSKKTARNVVFKSFTQAGGEGKSVGLIQVISAQLYHSFLI